MPANKDQEGKDNRHGRIAMPTRTGRIQRTALRAIAWDRQHPDHPNLARNLRPVVSEASSAKGM
eukprot:821833-Alexandrium_andersonii.AAC.1